jgi:hypothetical protein
MERVSQTRLQSLNLVLGEAVEDLLNIRVGENCERHLGKLLEKSRKLVNGSSKQLGPSKWISFLCREELTYFSPQILGHCGV